MPSCKALGRCTTRAGPRGRSKCRWRSWSPHAVAAKCSSSTRSRSVTDAMIASGPKLSGTVRKAFQILDRLSGPLVELAPREIAQQTGLDRTTVYRLLETLSQLGMVSRDERSRRYKLGLRTLDYAAATLDALELRHVAMSHLIDLERELVLAPDELERSIFIGVLDKFDIVLVEVGWSRSVFARTGGRMRFPAYASAAGRCIVAYMPDAERDNLLRHVEFARR